MSSIVSLYTYPRDVVKFSLPPDLPSVFEEIKFTLEEEETFASVWPQILACLCAASYRIGIGFIVGFSAILIPQLEVDGSEMHFNKHEISWITSVVPLVIPVASLIAGFIVDKIGRLNTIRLATIPNAMGWFFLATANNFPLLMVGRVLTGLSVAMGSNPAFIYITEVARSDLRGALLSMIIFYAGLGLLLMYIMGALLHWRTVAWISLSYCLIPNFLMWLWAVESPIWLLSKNRLRDAENSLSYLHRNNKQPDFMEQYIFEMTQELDSRQDQSDQRASAICRLFHGLAKPTGYKPLIILTTLFVLQQYCGMNITVFYAVSFISEMGSNVDPFVGSIGLGVVRLVFSLITTLLMSKFGRRPLCMVSGIGMAASMFASGFFAKEVAAGNLEPSMLPMVMMLIYTTLGVIGLQTIPWTMTAELFSLDIRGMAQGLCISIANILMFSALKVYPFLTESLGGVYAVHWLFAVMSLVTVVFVFLFLPETHKKTLPQIQEYFRYNTIYILRRKDNN